MQVRVMLDRYGRLKRGLAEVYSRNLSMRMSAMALARAQQPKPHRSRFLKWRTAFASIDLPIVRLVP